MYFVTKIALPGTAEAMVQEAVEFVGRTVETQAESLHLRSSLLSFNTLTLSTQSDE
jgi:hypothetical protein